MSIDENKSLNLRWIEAFNDRDWATEAACRAKGYVAHVSGVPVPLDGAGWDAFMTAFITAFPDAQISVADSFGEQNMVATRWTIAGTHRGDFQGVPPTGRPIAMAGVDVSRFVDGKIAEHWAQFDVISVMQQIAALPARA